MTNQSNELDRMIERYERPARIVREFGELAKEYPQVAHDLLNELTKFLPTNGIVKRGETQSQRVARLFKENGNTPLTKSQIAEQTEIPENSLHGIIYGQNTVLIRDGKRDRSATYRLRTDADQATGDSR